MDNNIQKEFSDSINKLVKMAKEKLNLAMETMEKEKEFKKSCEKSREDLENSINRINEVLDYDLTTAEGYSKYMEYLGNLRLRCKEYNTILKLISGKTAEEIIDEIAQEATTIYTNAQKDKGKPQETTNTFKKESSDSCSKEIIETNDDEYEDDEYEYDSCENTTSNPSDLVDVNVLESINRIVDRYIDESVIPTYNGRINESDLDWLTDELVEFGCWLNTQYPKK